MLALMTPAFLVGLGNQLLWRYMGETPSLWYTALGANVIWGIPFSFLVMLAVWNRYDRHDRGGREGPRCEQRDDVPRGDSAARLDGYLRQLPVRLHPGLERLRPDDLLQNGYQAQPLPILIGTWPSSRPILPNLYALGAGTTAVTLFLIFIVCLSSSTLGLRFRGAPVHDVEEEFGEEVGGNLDVAQAASFREVAAAAASRSSSLPDGGCATA